MEKQKDAYDLATDALKEKIEIRKFKNEIFTEAEKEANDLFKNSIKPKLNFKEDFLYDYALKYKKRNRRSSFL